MTSPHRKLLEKAGIVKRSDSAAQAAVKLSLVETASRAAVTATVTFAVGWVLKRMFEKSVEDKVSASVPKVKPSTAANSPPGSYKTAARREPAAGSAEG